MEKKREKIEEKEGVRKASRQHTVVHTDSINTLTNKQIKYNSKRGKTRERNKRNKIKSSAEGNEKKGKNENWTRTRGRNRRKQRKKETPTKKDE